MSADERLSEYRSLAEHQLDQLLPSAEQPPQRLHASMRYAVFGEGKRIRPAMAMASAVAAGGRPEDGLTAGCAVEMIHCFSLIHDDLPAIDDDDLRRGRPTVHRAFGEAVAVLAGDALFALAFKTLSGMDVEPAGRAEALAVLSASVGSEGLVGGEMMDVEAEGTTPDLAMVRQIHLLKTASLVSAACELGALSAGSDDQVRAVLREFGRRLGLAFQIVDDVLNETSTAEALGKAAGSDRERGKATYPACIGLDRSEAAARTELEAALSLLASLPGDVGPLRDIADSCVNREK